MNPAPKPERSPKRDRAWNSTMPKPSKRMGKRSKKPNRVQRAQEGAQHAREHHEAVRHCQAPEMGILTPCSGPLEHSHIIGKGIGGGQDYAVTDGACAMLCRTHHRALDTDRQAFRDAGLSRHAPRPAKVVPRPIERA